MLTIADYLKYANLQMAAEAFLRDENTKILVATPNELETALIKGNDHASKFPTKLAEDFVNKY